MGTEALQTAAMSVRIRSAEYIVHYGAMLQNFKYGFVKFRNNAKADEERSHNTKKGNGHLRVACGMM